MRLPKIFQLDWQGNYRTKIVTPMVMLTIAISAFVFFFFSAWLKDHALKTVKQEARSIGEVAALHFGSALLQGDTSNVVQSVKQAKNISDLVFMSVVLESGEEVASFNFSRNPPIEVKKTRNGEILADGLIYSTVSPINVNNREIGRLHTGLSLKAYNKDMLTIRTVMVSLSCIILVVGIMGILLVTKYAGKPIEDMASVAARVVEGDYSLQASTIYGKGLDRFADAFNIIVSDLVQKLDEVEALNNKMSQQEDQLKREVQARKKIEHSFLASLEATDTAVIAKSEIVGKICQKLSPSMASIIESTELLLDSSPNQNQLESISKIETSSQFITSLIHQLLDFAYVYSGNLVLDKTEFNLREGITRCIHPFTLKAKKKQILLLVEIEPSVPDSLVGDEKRLHQVVCNLLDNAIKFTEKGEVRLKIILEEGKVPGVQSSGRVCLHFSVSDTGIGITPGSQESIFDVFSKADTSSDIDEGGSGLGLAVARRLIELMDGFIWVDNREDKGSTFQFLAQFGKTEEHINNSENTKSMNAEVSTDELMHKE